MKKNKKIYLAVACYALCIIFYTTTLFTRNMIFMLLGSIFLSAGAVLMITETIKQMKK